MKTENLPRKRRKGFGQLKNEKVGKNTEPSKFSWNSTELKEEGLRRLPKNTEPQELNRTLETGKKLRKS